MYLDAAEDKMLRAIVQTAVVAAAAGRPFAGEFRHYRISATLLQVNEEGAAQVEARIAQGLHAMIRVRLEIVLGTSDEELVNAHLIVK